MEMYFWGEEIVYEKTEGQWNFIADGLYRGSSGNTVASIVYIFFKRKYFYGDSCVLSLVSNDVADGSVLFCNTIYPEKSKWPERRCDIPGYIINKLYRMCPLGTFDDWNDTSSMGIKITGTHVSCFEFDVCRGRNCTCFSCGIVWMSVMNLKMHFHEEEE